MTTLFGATGAWFKVGQIFLRRLTPGGLDLWITFFMHKYSGWGGVNQNSFLAKCP